MTKKHILWCDIVARAAYECAVFTRNLAMYDACWEGGSKKYPADDVVSITTKNNNIFSMVLIWCHFFRSFDDKHHWVNIIPNANHEDFRATLHNIAGSQVEWEKYHTSMSTFRDKFVAHIDRVDGFIPELRTGYETIKCLYEFLRKSNAGCLCWRELPDNLDDEYDHIKSFTSKRIDSYI
jgi:hypothetical protein